MGAWAKDPVPGAAGALLELGVLELGPWRAPVAPLSPMCPWALSFKFYIIC